MHVLYYVQMGTGGRSKEPFAKKRADTCKHGQILTVHMRYWHVSMWYWSCTYVCSYPVRMCTYFSAHTFRYISSYLQKIRAGYVQTGSLMWEVSQAPCLVSGPSEISSADSKLLPKDWFSILLKADSVLAVTWQDSHWSHETTNHHACAWEVSKLEAPCRVSGPSEVSSADSKLLPEDPTAIMLKQLLYWRWPGRTVTDPMTRQSTMHVLGRSVKRHAESQVRPRSPLLTASCCPRIQQPLCSNRFCLMHKSFYIGRDLTGQSLIPWDHKAPRMRLHQWIMLYVCVRILFVFQKWVTYSTKNTIQYVHLHIVHILYVCTYVYIL
jgi:hypothetical protein